MVLQLLHLVFPFIIVGGIHPLLLFEFVDRNLQSLALTLPAVDLILQGNLF